MKKIYFLLTFLAVNTAFAQHEHHAKPDTTQKAKKPLSPRTSAMAMITENHVHIDYGSPSVRGRQIWNGLVAYGQVWATGAHKATWIEFSNDVLITGKRLPKGKYGFFTIPGEKEWTLIISKDWNMHLADDYTEKNDVVRIKVIPKKNSNLVEALTYQVTETGKNKGQVKLSWEWVGISFDFENVK